VLMKFDSVRAVVLHDRVLLLSYHSYVDSQKHNQEKRLKKLDQVSIENEIFEAKVGEHAPPVKAGCDVLEEMGSKLKEGTGSKLMLGGKVIEGMVVMGIKVKEGVLDLSAKFSPKRKEEDEKNEADLIRMRDYSPITITALPLS